MNWYILLWSAVAVYSSFTIVFIIGQILKNASIVDIFWGMSFITTTTVIAVIYRDNIFTSDLSSLPFLVSYSLLIIWGLRLTINLSIRNIGKGEDFRYKNWRETYKSYKIRMYINYLIQATFSLSLTIPFIFMANNTINNEVTNYWFLLGNIITILGFVSEFIGDEQLRRFIKSKPGKDKVLKSGLWKYTRHPNYLGEHLIWLGFLVSSLSVNWTLGLIGIIPVLCFWTLLRFVSTPLVEKKMSEKSEWEDYKNKTSIIFPFIDKK
ncbi:MAG: DUF1295 domain-containing protein [Mycoplasmataceae bacterium]|nr:DUF1295 domain-containing protein [Mycoplasmataceae bacterium]